MDGNSIENPCFTAFLRLLITSITRLSYSVRVITKLGDSIFMESIQNFVKSPVVSTLVVGAVASSLIYSMYKVIQLPKQLQKEVDDSVNLANQRIKTVVAIAFVAAAATLSFTTLSVALPVLGLIALSTAAASYKINSNVKSYPKLVLGTCGLPMFRR